MRVRVRAQAGDLELRTRPVGDERIDGELLRLDERVVGRILRTTLAEGHEHVFRSLLATTRGGIELGSRRSLLEQLTRAVARNELVFVRRALHTLSGTRSEPPPEIVPLQPEVEELDWIEILVEDQEGVPLRDISYEITLADGAKRRGRTNREGIARLDGISRGQCKFSLTTLDESAWEAG
jgi:hypothetical protein